MYGCTILECLDSLCILIGCRFWNSNFLHWFISELIQSLQLKISRPEIPIKNSKLNVFCISQSPSEGPGFWWPGPAQVLENSWLTTTPALEPRSWLQREERKCYSRWVCSGITTLIFSSYIFLFSLSLNIYCLWSLITKQVAEKCLSLGAQKALYITADMSSDSDPDKVVDFALEKLGGLDYLVLNHIGSSPFSMWQGDVEHTKWLMQVLQHLHLIFSLLNERNVLNYHSVYLSLSLTLRVCVCVHFLKVNFFSYIQMAWRSLPSLEQSKGSMVIVSSLLGTFLNK